MKSQSFVGEELIRYLKADQKLPSQMYPAFYKRFCSFALCIYLCHCRLQNFSCMPHSISFRSISSNSNDSHIRCRIDIVEGYGRKAAGTHIWIWQQKYGAIIFASVWISKNVPLIHFVCCHFYVVRFWIILLFVMEVGKSNMPQYNNDLFECCVRVLFLD